MRLEKAYRLVRTILRYDDDILDILTPHLEGSILSVGCGEGRVERRLQDGGWRIRGLEITPYAQSHIPVQRYDGHTLPYKDKSVDTVMFIYVLHHAKDPEQLLREAARVARKRVLILDHTYTNRFSHALLVLYDGGVNVLYRMPIPFHFYRVAEWFALFKKLPVRVEKQNIPTALTIFFSLVPTKSSSD